MSDEMMNIINQARRQARSDNLKNILFKNLKVIIRVAVLIALAAIIFFAYRTYQRSQEEKYSHILHQSLINQQIGDVQKAKDNLKEIYESSSAPSGVKALASLRYAAFFLEEGNKTQAAKIYLSVHECGSCDDYLRDLAGLLAVKTWVIDEGELQKADLVSRMEKIENNSGILRYNVAEQIGLLELQRNNLEKSYQVFEKISQAQNAPKALKSRAEDEMKMVIEKGYVPKIALVKDENKTEEKAGE